MYDEGPENGMVERNNIHTMVTQAEILVDAIELKLFPGSGEQKAHPEGIVTERNTVISSLSNRLERMIMRLEKVNHELNGLGGNR